MPFKFIRLALISVLGTLSMTGMTFAQVKVLGSYKDWQVYTQKVDGDTVCFAATPAFDKAPKDVRHGDIHFFVANWKSGVRAGQPSLKVGYELRSDLPPKAIIGRQNWRMYTSANEAFVEDKDDRALVKALQKGSQLRVEAVSSRSTRTAYHFSLKGSSAAIDRAAKACK
jgi:hypothetical protein